MRGKRLAAVAVAVGISAVIVPGAISKPSATSSAVRPYEGGWKQTKKADGEFVRIVTEVFKHDGKLKLRLLELREGCAGQSFFNEDNKKNWFKIKPSGKIVAHDSQEKGNVLGGFRFKVHLSGKFTSKADLKLTTRSYKTSSGEGVGACPWIEKWEIHRKN